MNTTLTAKETLDRSYLDIRSRILDIAASLDRIDRSAQVEAVRQDARLRQVRQAVAVLTDGGADRAQRIQLSFSLPYDPDWQASG